MIERIYCVFCCHLAQEFKLFPFIGNKMHALESISLIIHSWYEYHSQQLGNIFLSQIALTAVYAKDNNILCHLHVLCPALHSHLKCYLLSFQSTMSKAAEIDYKVKCRKTKPYMSPKWTQTWRGAVTFCAYIIFQYK